MKRLIVLALSLAGIVAIVLAVLSGAHDAWTLLPAVPFFMAFTHSTLSDQTDTKLEFGSQLLTGAAGAQNGIVIDTQGWEGVLFSLAIGVITGAGALDAWIQSGSAANGSDAANVASGAITQVLAANQNSVVQISIYRPTNRFVRLQFNQTVNNVQVGAVATLFRRSGVNPTANVGGPAQSPVQILKIVQN